MKKITIKPASRIHMYSDGATRPTNPGPSAWGVVIVYPNGQIAQHHQFIGHGTNNSSELKGFIEGLRRIEPKSPVKVHLDSKYVLDSITKNWVHGWKKNNWKTAKGNEVANINLWKEVLEIIKDRDIEYKWIKGHSGDIYNEMADKLASLAIDQNTAKEEK